MGWAAIGGGVLVGLAAWLPWAAGEVEGSAEELEVVEAGFDLASVAQLPILGTLLGLALVACGVVVVRSGIAAAVGTAAMVAWIPAAIAGGLILSESVVDDLGDKADRVAKFRFPDPAPCGRTPLTASGLSKSYGSLEVFTDVTFSPTCPL